MIPPKDILNVDYANSTFLSPVEAEVLSQYQLLAVQLNTLSNELKDLNSVATEINRKKGESENESTDELEGNSASLLDNLRNLEVKIGLVYTLFKGAVYALFLQNEEDLNLQNEQREEERSESEAEAESDLSSDRAKRERDYAAEDEEEEEYRQKKR